MSIEILLPLTGSTACSPVLGSSSMVLPSASFLVKVGMPTLTKKDADGNTIVLDPKTGEQAVDPVNGNKISIDMLSGESYSYDAGTNAKTYGVAGATPEDRRKI